MVLLTFILAREWPPRARLAAAVVVGRLAYVGPTRNVTTRTEEHAMLVFVLACASMPFALTAAGIDGPREPGYLGVMIRNNPDGKGAKVEGVQPDTPAEKSGLQVGDLILKVEDQEVENLNDLVQKIVDRRPGETVKLTVKREDKEKEIKVKLMRRPKFEGSPA
jgi:S1-C subfamily serine protease